MPGFDIGLTTGFGFPGQESRGGGKNITRTHPVNTASDNIYFGDPVTMGNDATVFRADETFTADAFAGVAIRRVKSATLYPNQNDGFYAPFDNADILLEGFVSAVCHAGTPVPGGAVTVRTAENAAIPAGVVGGFEATLANDCVTLTNAKWASTADANNVAEMLIQWPKGV